MQQDGNGLGPKLQQRRTHPEAFTLGLGDQVGKFLADPVAGGKGDGLGQGVFLGLLQLVAFRHGDQAVEQQRLHAEEFQLERAELAGAQHRLRRAVRHETVTRLEFVRLAALEQVTDAFRHPRYRPAGRGRRPFTRRAEGKLLQDEMSFKGHQPT